MDLSNIGSAAGNIISDLYGTWQESENTKKANEENAKINEMNKDWQHKERLEAQDYASAEAVKAREYTTSMSNSAYQRSMEDMKKAGLNPILAAGNGGASTPSSPSPSSSAGSGSSIASQKSNVGAMIQKIIPQMISSSAEMKRVGNETKKANSEVQTNLALQDLYKTNQLVNNASAAEIQARIPGVKAKSDFTADYPWLESAISAASAAGVGAIAGKLMSGKTNSAKSLDSKNPIGFKPR